MDKQLLKNLQSSDVAAVAVEKAVTGLRQSGVLDFLRDRGTVQVRPNSSVTSFAFEAAELAGYNRALNELVNFKEIFLMRDLTKPMPAQTYGGIERAHSRGDISEEEFKKLTGQVLDENSPL